MSSPKASLLLLFLLSFIAGCSGDADIPEPEPNESSKAVYDQLIELDGEVELDAEGNITAAALNSEQVGNEDLDGLLQLSTLVELNLSGSGIDNKGLEKLADLTNLTVLEVEDTKVTRRGVMKLRESLDQCRINSEFEFEDEDDEDAE